jgi:lipoprotein-anchoring transpeptidase ErfK/SrfK
MVDQPRPAHGRHRRAGARWRAIAAGGLLLVLVAAGGFGVKALTGPAHRAAAAGRTRPTPPPTTSTTAITQAAGNDSTLVATLANDEQGYGSPGGAASTVVPGSWHGAASVLPVIARSRGWLEVRLAQRPNESTAWIQSAGIALTATPYRIVVDLATMHLSLYDAGSLVMSAPAGIGTNSTPTPTGSFFVAFLEQAPSPGYGAFIMVTSAHSNVIADFENSGDAIIGIHGPLGADAEIGTTGAQISNGCIRLHDADLAQLQNVPPGSPIQIID